MRTYASYAVLGFGLVAAMPAAHAQVIVAQPYETFIVRPSGTLISPSPLIAVSTIAAQPMQIVPAVETVRTVRPVQQPIVRRQIVASRAHFDRVAFTNNGRRLYDTVTTRVVETTPVVQTIAAPVVAPAAPGQALNLSGQFTCVAGCPAGLAGPGFVTQNGWDLNLVNEFGVASRAWIDYPGHIWVQGWNEGAVYSPDGMTIQFDRGTVWARNLVIVPMQPVLR
jgi:hypothetical protein